MIPLMKSNLNMTLIAPEANRHFVADRLGIDPIVPLCLNDGVSVWVGGFRFTGVPAAHEELEQDEAGRRHIERKPVKRCDQDNRRNQPQEFCFKNHR